MASLADCSVDVYSQAGDVGAALIDYNYTRNVVFGEYICTPFKWEYLVNLVSVMLWLVIARWLYDAYVRARRGGAATPFKLAEELTKRDNPALAIDFASFLFAICLITRGSLLDLQPAINNERYFGAFFTYQAVGCAVLLVSRFLNDKLMLRKADNLKAIVEERSVAVGCVEAGATISTAIIFAAAAGGQSVNFGEGVAATLLYWAIGQVLLLLYGNAVDLITSLPALSPYAGAFVDPSSGGPPTKTATSLLKEAAGGNVAAGLSVGFDMVHAGILIAAPVYVGYSLLAWVIFLACALLVVSPLMHLYIDFIVLRGAGYTVNVLRHKNWGAAFLLGLLKLLTALLLMSSYKENCDPQTLNTVEDDYSLGCVVKPAESLVGKLATVAVPNVFNWQVLINLLVLLVIILFTKGVYVLRFANKSAEGGGSFSLDKTLADPANNAVSVSYALYTFAQGLVVVGVVYCPDSNAGLHAANLILFTAIGCALLLVAFKINDCVLLNRVSNTDMLAADNVAIAIFEGGSFAACGIILRASLMGESDYDYGASIGLTALYWVVGQLILLLFAYVYRLITIFDDWEQLKENNTAAGISGGVTLVALAVAMSYAILYYTSLLVVLPISLLSVVVLMLLRAVVDKLILPGDNLDSEIVNDKNWGAALIEASVALGIAFISNMYVPQPGANYVSPTVPYFDVCGSGNFNI